MNKCVFCGRDKPRFVRYLIVTCLFLFLAGCGGGGGSDDDSAESVPSADWTYMVYMGADNNLSTAGIIDLNEMEAAGSDEKVNVVLQAEFSSFYTNFAGIGYPDYNGETLRFLVQDDGNPGNVNLAGGQPIGNVNMGSTAALTDFIQWTVATYPAKHYALVIWDHGAGWKKSSLFKGAVQDETSDSFMTCRIWPWPCAIPGCTWM